LSRRPHRQHGFTLIELMVTIAVTIILLLIAIPSFMEFRQRAALRGAGDQLLSFWADARFAAVRENRPVTVSFRNSGGIVCIGATTATTACDCASAPAACDIARFPADQSEWRRVRVPAAATLGQGTGMVTIDPKRGNISDPADAGAVLLQGPPLGVMDYRLNFLVDRNGRAILCEPTAAPSKLPQYADRRC
jgi:prepilin-type N-terminal cleavage/methylation domain-containing protein